MRIVEINMTHVGSTGKIMVGIAECARQRGHEVYTFSPREYQRRKKTETPAIYGHEYFGSRFENMLHIIFSEITGFQGCFSVFGTLQLIRKIKRIQPDVIHLHNLHNRTINIPLLFSYLKKSQSKTIWTLHDCWPVTGQCPHFTMEKCEKWKTGCGHCTQTQIYPKAYVDRTAVMWKLKRKWFTGLENMTLVTPSLWLANIIMQSFLKDYPTKVINNGIDLDLFCPMKVTPNDERLVGKKIVLGVAFDWSRRKGFDIFQRLSRELPEQYQIVLVGTDDSVDKELPQNVISIHQTNNQKELARFYSIADVFVNPTREDNFPTVNIEALACGTPVITFRTGGSPEIPDDRSGIVVECDDFDALKQKIRFLCEHQPIDRNDCRKRAEEFDMYEKFRQYVELYAE